MWGFYVTFSHYSRPMTLNKQLPWTMVWTSLSVQLSNTPVQMVVLNSRAIRSINLTKVTGGTCPTILRFPTAYGSPMCAARWNGSDIFRRESNLGSCETLGNKCQGVTRSAISVQQSLLFCTPVHSHEVTLCDCVVIIFCCCIVSKYEWVNESMHCSSWIHVIGIIS